MIPLLWSKSRNQLLPQIALGFHRVCLSAFGCGLGQCMQEMNMTSSPWSISYELPICFLCLLCLVSFLLFVSIKQCMCLFMCVNASIQAPLCWWLHWPFPLWGSPWMTNSHICYQPPLFHKINSLTSFFFFLLFFCCIYGIVLLRLLFRLYALCCEFSKLESEKNMWASKWDYVTVAEHQPL